MARQKSGKKETEWLVLMAIASVVFIVWYAIYTVFGFLTNCIFEWPVRWDVGTCWNEQIQPAKEKAIEKAANFIP
jgi:hypothetical protein